MGESGPSIGISGHARQMASARQEGKGDPASKNPESRKVFNKKSTRILKGKRVFATVRAR